MKKILFLIHDLGVGGAEKVLVNLVNHMDPKQFDITVVSLFGGGVNEQFLAHHIKYKTVFNNTVPGNSKIMKVFTPKQLHHLCIKDRFDVEIAYLEGPAARIISGCDNPDTKLIGWIHIEQHSKKCAAGAFRSFRESECCYKRFSKIVCVSNTVKKDFQSIYPQIKNICVRYNTIETERILCLKDEAIDDIELNRNEINLVAVGKISKNKGFDRLARIVYRLHKDGLKVHLYALGVGPDQELIEDYLMKNNLLDYYSFLGYKLNPYKYVANCDLFVCASMAEGFSTATVESLIVGTPVCTVEVSGMKEMLGYNNEWGMVTDNDDESLYNAIHQMITTPGLLSQYKEKAAERGKIFSTANTVKAVEDLINSMINE